MVKKLAVLILTFNEEKNIDECVQSVKFADEIILIDSGSTDQTCEIAEKLGAKFIYHPMDGGFAGQRNFALKETEAEWVLFLDADERITPELALEIKNVVEKDEQFAYEILRYNHVLGQPMNYGSFRPDFSLRLYPRTCITWSGLVHEKAQVSLPKRKLNNKMLHYTYSDWESYFTKFNKYTRLMAEKMIEEGKQATMFDIVLRPLWGFFRVYILQSGWRDGKLGFIMAIFHAYYTVVKYVKMYDWQENE